MFDRFAAWAAKRVASAGFFAACVAIVVIWAPSYFVFSNVDTWQLVINTTTTIITFLLVALLQNTQDRFERQMKKEQQVERFALAELLHDMQSKRPNRNPRIDRIIDQLEGHDSE